MRFLVIYLLSLTANLQFFCITTKFYGVFFTKAIKKRHPKTFILQDKKDACQPPVLKRTFHDWFCYNYNTIARKNSMINTIQTRTRRQEPQPSSRNSKMAPRPFNSQPKIPPPVKMMNTNTMMPMIANISISTLFDFQIGETLMQSIVEWPRIV